MEKKGYLLLANGQLYEGVLRGAKKNALAELVFTTSVVGYMDALTDPAYAGRILVQTFPVMGCYGVVPLEDEAAKPALSGYVVRQLVDTPSNFRCTGKLDDYLAEHGVTCIEGVDTRAIARAIRDQGVMNAAILTEKPEDIEAACEEIAAWQFTASVTEASCEDVIPAATKGMNHVVVVDLGAKADCAAELEKRGCAVTVVPADMTAKAILAFNPDGVLLTNGPGDPAENGDILTEVQILAEERIPMFAIGLGHQLLAMSQGAQVKRLKYGHRGGNQPLRDVKTGANYISSQNHGFAVDGETLPEGASVRFINTNDGSCEGVDYAGMPAFSVQFQPQACGGPQDTRMLYDRFIAMMGGNRNAAES